MDKIVKRSFVAILSAVLVFGVMPTTVFGQASNGFTTSWSLDPNDHTDIFPFGGSWSIFSAWCKTNCEASYIRWKYSSNDAKIITESK